MRASDIHIEPHRKGVRVRRNYLMEWLRPRYQRFLEKYLDRRIIILPIAGAVFALSLVVLAMMGTEFLPELDEGSILVPYPAMPGTLLAPGFPVPEVRSLRVRRARPRDPTRK